MDWIAGNSLYKSSLRIYPLFQAQLDRYDQQNHHI